METFINKLLDLRIFRWFRVKTTPRWIILLLDMLIVLVSFIATVVADMYSTHFVQPSGTILLNAFLVFAVYFANFDKIKGETSSPILIERQSL